VDIATIAALVLAVVAGGVDAFQLALALGAPWSSYAIGGARPVPSPAASREREYRMPADLECRTTYADSLAWMR
jgi:hypothetical protein